MYFAQTRSRESNQILDLLRSGRSVSIVCLTGEGALDFGRSLADALGRPDQSLLRISTQSRTEEVAELVDFRRLNGGPRIMSGTHLLAGDTVPAINQALRASRLPIAYLVDRDLLLPVHQGGHSVLKHIAESWGARMHRPGSARRLGDSVVSRLIELRLTREFEVSGQPCLSIRQPSPVAAVQSMTPKKRSPARS